MERLLDARWLPPPEPMERVLAALETLAPGERIRLLIHREPFPLYEILKAWGYRHYTHSCDDGSYEVVIWRAEGGVEEAAP
jgi:uncharacterized protein (DUF2249 family)